MSTQDSQHTWKEITTENDIVKEYILDAGDGLVFERSYWRYEWDIYSAKYNGILIKESLDGTFYEGDGYWYGFNYESMQKYHFDNLIFEIIEIKSL